MNTEKKKTIKDHPIIMNHPSTKGKKEVSSNTSRGTVILRQQICKLEILKSTSIAKKLVGEMEQTKIRTLYVFRR